MTDIGLVLLLILLSVDTKVRDTPVDQACMYMPRADPRLFGLDHLCSALSACARPSTHRS